MAMFAHGKGVSFENRWTLGIEELFNYKIPVPLENEQDKIADFLDEQCEKINLAIEKAKVSIEEYRNLKQSFITQIVTKGINENDTMKESGIEWIGKIPASWKVTQLRHCASIRSYQNANLIQYAHRQRNQRKREHIRCRRNNCGNNKDNHNSMFPISPHKIRRKEPQLGEQPR